MIATERVINDLNVAKLMLCNPQALTPEMCVKIGQAISSAIALPKDQEPKTGVWIPKDDDANLWECSECGELQEIIFGTPYENGWHFCPHCGAKLKEQAVK